MEQGLTLNHHHSDLLSFPNLERIESDDVVESTKDSFDELVIVDENTGRKTVKLASFLGKYGNGLLEQSKNLRPSLFRADCPKIAVSLDELAREPVGKQSQAIQAALQLLEKPDQRAAILNAEMGTGKTFMGIAAAYHLYKEQGGRCLVLSPPHLVYKWRREIKKTIHNAKVVILNGSDTLRKLIELTRHTSLKPEQPEFYVIGRVRMKTGHHWQASYSLRYVRARDDHPSYRACACSQCGTFVCIDDRIVPMARGQEVLGKKQYRCDHCANPLFTFTHPKQTRHEREELVKRGLLKVPTIGNKKAEQLLEQFGVDLIGETLDQNIHDFIHFMDEDGDFVFKEKQRLRMEKGLANMEFALGQGGYQPSEFIKRYLPRGFFSTLLVDEGHEYKNLGSAQGQAMGVLSAVSKKVILLTGTLMGGYAEDLFFLLFRLNPKRFVDHGFKMNTLRLFNRIYGLEKVICTSHKDLDSTGSFTQSKGQKLVPRVSAMPGFSPEGIMRFVLPNTVFLKLKDLGEGVLPPYQEHYREIPMSSELFAQYSQLASSLKHQLRESIRAGDRSLLGVVLNTLLAYPDCSFRDELVYHPHKRTLIARASAVFSEDQASEKELALIDLCLEQKKLFRRVLVYTIYTGVRDTASRLKRLLERQGLKVSVLRATVSAETREAWIEEEVERGCDVLICNPELVKTGLDLLEFPTIAFMQTGYNVYTVSQASRRSWRLGQTQPIHVYFLGYAGTAQETALKLMAQKIAVSQSVSGDVPDCGLDILNTAEDSIDVEIAKQLLAT